MRSGHPHGDCGHVKTGHRSGLADGREVAGREGRGRRIPRVRTLLLAAVGALLLLVPGEAPLAAQTLDRVEELVREDRIQEAREALVAWESASGRPSREDRQRALWYRGVLTLDPTQADATFRRLALEYPGGTYSDRALHRLGESAALRGDLREAERHFSVLVRDYLNSPHRVEAQDWLRRNRAALDELPEAAEDDGPEMAPPPRSDPRGTPPLPDAALRPAPGAGDYAAQVGAFTTVDNARTVADRLREAGFRPRIVRLGDDAFFRVRVGRFEVVEDARALVGRLREAGFEAGLGTGATRERPAG